MAAEFLFVLCSTSVNKDNSILHQLSKLKPLTFESKYICPSKSTVDLTCVFDNNRVIDQFVFIQILTRPGQQADLSSLVSEGFVRFFVELVGHYPFHMVESSNGSRELQRDSFRKSHPSRGVRQFLQLFMDTQMFAGFIQDKELRKGGGRGNGDDVCFS